MFTQPFSVQSSSNHRKEHLIDRSNMRKDDVSQLENYYAVFKQKANALLKNQYLHQVLEQDEALFYRLVQRHLKEMLPILYTPTVGEVVQKFHHMRSKTRGLYIRFSDQASIAELLEPYASSSIDIAVLTDGERILGLGDQGVGGIEICIAKAMMYVICARLAPYRLLPIYLDVGTNNSTLLEDPSYTGWRHPRIVGQDYDDFIDKVVTALQKKFPGIYLHWEDIEKGNANRLLSRYQNQYCTFNDDIQGTAVVTLASALTAMKLTQTPLTEQRIIIFGGGAAGVGIADQLCRAMQRIGLTQVQAQQKIWLIGRYGLLFTDSSNLTTLQTPYARPANERVCYETLEGSQEDNLISVIRYVKPTFLVGCSGQAGAFTKTAIETMAHYVTQPIIFPLSNPITCCEATPQDILKWTKNKALVATGSPFEDVVTEIDGKRFRFPISQCNNALAFPGIGLGVRASRTPRLTEEMLWQACLALCEATPPSKVYPEGYPILLPDMGQIHEVSEKIAYAIYQVAQKETRSEQSLSILDSMECIRAQYWPLFAKYLDPLNH